MVAVNPLPDFFDCSVWTECWVWAVEGCDTNKTWNWLICARLHRWTHNHLEMYSLIFVEKELLYKRPVGVLAPFRQKLSKPSLCYKPRVHAAEDIVASGQTKICCIWCRIFLTQCFSACCDRKHLYKRGRYDFTRTPPPPSESAWSLTTFDM